MVSMLREYMNQTVVLEDRTLSRTLTFSSGVARSNIKVRWEDVLIEAPDVDDISCLCTAKVVTTSAIKATPKMLSTDGMGNDLEQWYLYRDGVRYRIVQHKIMPDLDGAEVYRELLVTQKPTLTHV